MIQPGQRLPDVKLQRITADGSRGVSTAELVEDGVVRTLNVEPAGGVTVSGAEAVLEAL